MTSPKRTVPTSLSAVPDDPKLLKIWFRLNFNDRASDLKNYNFYSKF